jgi:hypothetical protein
MGGIVFYREDSDKEEYVSTGDDMCTVPYTTVFWDKSSSLATRKLLLPTHSHVFYYLTHHYIPIYCLLHLQLFISITSLKLICVCKIYSVTEVHTSMQLETVIVC